MKLVLLAFIAAAALPAQTLTFSIPATYQFPDTGAWSSSSITVEVTNASTTTVSLDEAWVGSQAGSTEVNHNFTVTGFDVDGTVAPGSSKQFTLSFTPSTTGPLTGYLQLEYSVQQNGCLLPSQNPTPVTACPSSIVAVSTLQGNGTATALVLSYNPGSGLQDIQPNASSPLSFGNVVVGNNQSIVFTISNRSTASITVPVPVLQAPSAINPTNNAFGLDVSSLPATLAPGASGTFTVTFAPQQEATDNTTLLVGSNLYPLTGNGTGSPGSEDAPLQVSYVDSTGARTQPQGSAIDFGQLTAGTATTNTLKFTLANPNDPTQSFNTATVSNISVTGAAFSISGLPTFPASIPPGGSITFAVTFAAGAQGTASGTLTIGPQTMGGVPVPTQSFSLTGESVVLPLPSVSLQVSPNPLTSQQQATLTVQLAGASPIQAIGQLAMTFKPSVANVSDDPAINFIANNSRMLQVNVAAGAQTATYNGQSALTFQTGTTAGTITFTLTFPDLAPITQSFTITPAAIVITSANASWQEPNLVVTVDGYDNTYSAGQLLFMFYDTAGNPILPNGMPVNAASQFQQYFFTNNQAGGAFGLQASFPVSGEDVSHIGSVSLTMTNSAGQTSTNRLNQ